MNKLDTTQHGFLLFNINDMLISIIRDIFSIKHIDKIKLWSHSRAVRFVNKLQLDLIRVNMITETLLALE